MKVVNRKTKEERDIVYSHGVKFLYKSIFGRIVLKLLNNKVASSIVGCYMNSGLSKRRILKIVNNNKIDMSIYEDKDFTCFNDFFIRHKKDLKFDLNRNDFVSPADAKLLVYKLNKDASFDIKNSIYSLKDIINVDLTNEYQNGYALVFRLEITDYHRYHFIDNGKLDNYTFIPGCLNTVQPIAFNHYKVFHRNAREYTILHTENFGDVVEIEVGAMMVGKISNNKEIKKFSKGDEKGYFEFGGSTIILFVKDNKVIIDDDILLNSTLGKETIVSCGEKIGVKYTTKMSHNKLI